ncbi:MAG: hypothetical protein DMD54_16040 [Gemmatimonadetes bacterium]|nr:MAG: hypothetical protein DMD54_16040 [Gemmatimonadota bacterium]
MTVNKDFKRLVRARMLKTGEAYTTARRRILETKTQPVKIDYATLAGMSDATIKARTGCTWKRWVGALDYVGADTWEHGKIATYVHEKFKIAGWWAQNVTVGYERIKGLRAIGQRRDGRYEASKTKIFPVSLARLYRAWSDAKARKGWLPDEFTVTTANRNKTMRIRWPDGSNVAVYFYGKGAGKAQVNVQHMKLNKDGQTRMKAFWTEKLGRLDKTLQ